MQVVCCWDANGGGDQGFAVGEGDAVGLSRRHVVLTCSDKEVCVQGGVCTSFNLLRQGGDVSNVCTNLPGNRIPL